MVIQRITTFKVPEANVQTVLDAYKVLGASHEKDGKPYILDLTVFATIPNERNQGYAVVSMSKYKDLADMKFYDEDCPAHKQLKKTLNGKVDGGPLVMYGELPAAK